MIPATYAAAVLICAPITNIQAELFLGPPNPTIDPPGDWFSGGDVEFPEEGGYIEGTGRIDLGTTDPEGSADFRSQAFELGPAAGGAQTVDIEFFFKFLEEVQEGDDVLVQFRFFDDFEDQGGNFVGEVNIAIPGNPEDTGVDPTLVDEWQSHLVADIEAPEEAQVADIRTSINIFTDWASGGTHWDNFQVTTALPPLETPVPVELFPVTAVEFDTAGHEGVQFQIEAYRPDQDAWEPVSEIIVGNGETITRMFSTRTEPGPFRVRQNAAVSTLTNALEQGE